MCIPEYGCRSLNSSDLWWSNCRTMNLIPIFLCKKKRDFWKKIYVLSVLQIELNWYTWQITYYIIHIFVWISVLKSWNSLCLRWFLSLSCTIEAIIDRVNISDVDLDPVGSAFIWVRGSVSQGYKIKGKSEFNQQICGKLYFSEPKKVANL